MSGNALSRRGFLGHLGGAAATAVVVTVPVMTAQQRREKAEAELIAALLELNPGATIRQVHYNDLTMIRAHVI